ncbi:MAG: SDR family NAD(P)-dependent oxidoreductase [bacterium]
MADKKTVFITGAGRGLGKAIALRYTREGFRVFATDRDETLLDTLPRDKHFRVLKMDVTQEKSIQQTAETIRKLTSQIDVLVSNAGIFDFYPLSEAGSIKLGRILEVNVLALSSLTKYFTPLMTGGRLIVISSESYKVPSPFQPYAVSKQALESLFQAIRLELATQGIRSILIRPGAMKTQILEETIHYQNKLTETRFKAVFDEFLQSVPKYIGRVVTPDRVAEVVLKAGIGKHPKTVYNINHNPLVSLLSYLPARIQEKLVLRTLKR